MAVVTWVEKDMAGGEIVNALVLIMRTNGCCWAKSGSGGCTMCGYRTASLNGVTEEDLNAQIDQALAKYKGEPFVKIYTSGSFFDSTREATSFRNLSTSSCVQAAAKSIVSVPRTDKSFLIVSKY